MRVETLVRDLVLEVHDFLTPEQCRAFVARSEVQGYEEALLSDGSRREDVRNNDRLLFDDAVLAAGWYQVLAPVLPDLGYARPCGLNERFRFYRYRPGQRFRTHTDGVFQRGNGEFSQFTVLVYLNDDMLGGETRFTRLQVVPETGKALIFHHHIEHAGAPVTQGQKYVLRTDAMYRRVEED